MTSKIDQSALDQLFSKAHTHNVWTDRPVADALLKELVDLMRWPPTSANCSPARIIFATSDKAKNLLASISMDSNQDKIKQAPVCAIIGHDIKFHDHLPRLFPHTDAKAWFVGNDELIETTAFRNGTLQAAYLMLAARALGLDCGPMSGFDNAAVDTEFFRGTSFKSNFLCNIGYGDPKGIYPRAPRFSFDEMAKIV